MSKGQIVDGSGVGMWFMGAGRGAWTVADVARLGSAGADVHVPDEWGMCLNVARKLARKVTGRGGFVNEATLADLAAAGHAAVLAWRSGVAMPGQDKGAAGVAWRAAVAELDSDQFGRRMGSDLVPWDEATAALIESVGVESAAGRRLQVGRWLQERKIARRPGRLGKVAAAATAAATAGLDGRSAGRRKLAMERAFSAVAAVVAGASVDEAAGAAGFKASGKRGGPGDALADYLARVGVYDSGFQWGVTQGKVKRFVECGGPVAGDRPAARESVRDLVKAAARARVQARKARKLASGRKVDLPAVGRVWVAGPPWVSKWAADEPAAVRAPRGKGGRIGGRSAAVSFRRPVAAVAFATSAAGPMARARAEYVAWWRDVLRLDLPAVRRVSDGDSRLCGTLGKLREQLRAADEFGAWVDRFGRLASLDVGKVAESAVVCTGGGGAEYVAWWRAVLSDCGRVQAGGRAAVRAVCDAAGVWMV